jgi:hypothetical protein
LLVGHFIFDLGFVDLEFAIPDTTRKAAEQFCKRARASYFETYSRQQIPQEARTAKKMDLLRTIYPESLNTGCLVHDSRVDRLKAA